MHGLGLKSQSLKTGWDCNPGPRPVPRNPRDCSPSPGPVSPNQHGPQSQWLPPSGQTGRQSQSRTGTVCVLGLYRTTSVPSASRATVKSRVGRTCFGAALVSTTPAYNAAEGVIFPSTPSGSWLATILQRNTSLALAETSAAVLLPQKPGLKSQKPLSTASSSSDLLPRKSSPSTSQVG